MTDWPATLPQSPLIEGFEYEFGEGAIHTEMDIGPPKSRRRSSSVAEPLIYPILVDMTQLSDLKTFFYTTTGMGVSPFNMPTPFGTKLVKFTKAPKPKVAGRHDLFRVDLELVILP